MAKKTKPPWENRIVGHADVDPATLMPHPDNWRGHPDIQKNTMQAAFQELGWLQSITVSQRSGNILDGHMRVVLAMQAGLPTVPVEYVDVSEDDERKALVTINPLATMFEANAAALEGLLSTMESDDAALRGLLESLAIEHDIVPGGAGNQEQESISGGANTLQEEFEPLAAPESNVRMVQLFLTNETYPGFEAQVRMLSKYYGTTTITDTVLEALVRADNLVNANM